MLKEWIKTTWHFHVSAIRVMATDVNGRPFSLASRCAYHLFFVGLTVVIVLCLPNGISRGFIDYIKDIFAIFVGFFVTVLAFVYDKLDITKIPTQEEMDELPADMRWDSKKVMRVKREHNYTIRFFYTVGMVILFSTLAICLLIPNIFWPDFFDVKMGEYYFLSSITDVSWESIALFFHLSLCNIYRFMVVFLTIKILYYTFYSVSSLLQVLISKKKLETWN